MSDVQANYDAMHTAADAGDADLAQRLGDAVIESPDASDDQRAYANWRVGDTLARAGRNEEAKPYMLQAAQLGDANVQQMAYQTLSDLAQFEDASDDGGLGTRPASRIAAAREALERGDADGAVELAAQVFDDDEAETVGKAEAALIAAEALFSAGRDDHAELYAGWAAEHGTAEQQQEARTLLQRWRRYERADRAMDDGVTTRERSQVLTAADTALLNSDWSTAQTLLLELYEREGSELTPDQFSQMAYGLGQTYFEQTEYATARGWFVLVVTGNAVDHAREYVERIDQLQAQAGGAPPSP